MLHHSINTETILKSVAMLGAVTATGAVTTTVAHADSTTTNTQTQSQATTAQDQLANLKQSQTQAEYAKNQAVVQPQIDQLQSQLKSQQASQAADDTTKVAVKTTEVNLAATNATDQANEAYYQAVASENNAYSGAKAAQEAINVANEQQQASANAEALKAASANIVTSEKQAQQKEDAQLSYQEQTRQLDGQHTVDIKKAAENHNQAVDNLNAQIKASQTQASQNHDKQLNQAAQTVTDANAHVEQTAQTESQASQAVTNAQKDYDTAKQALDNAKTKAQSTNNYNISAKITGHYKLAPEAIPYIKDPAANNYHAPKTTGDYLTSDPVYYNPDPEDVTKNEMLPGTNTYTGFTANALAQQVANDVNQIRDQFGTQHVYVSDYFTKLGEEIMTRYNESNTPALKHNTKLLADIQAETKGIGVAECINGDPNSGVNINNALFNLIVHDADSHEAHAQILAGVGVGAPWPNCTQYISYNQDKYGMTHINIFYVPNSMVDHSKDLPLIDTPAKPAEGTDTSAEQKAVDDALTKLNAAKDAYTKAAQAHTDAVNAAKTAQANYDQLKAGQIADSPAVTNLKQQLQTENAAYAAKLDQINHNYQLQAKRLSDQYQERLDKINAEPTNVNALKAQLDAKLNAVKQNGRQALQELDKNHQAKLDQLANDHRAKVDAIQTDAQKQLTDYKQQLAADHTKENQALVDQITKLQLDLSTKKSQLDQQLTDLKAKNAAEYQALADKLAPKQSESDAVKGNADSYTTENGQTIELKPGEETTNADSTLDGKNVKVTTDDIPTVSDTPATNTTYPTREQVRKQAEKLPQTGDNNSIAIVALGVLGSMFGLGLVRNIKERKL